MISDRPCTASGCSFCEGLDSFPRCSLCGHRFTGRGHSADATVHFNCTIVLKHNLMRLAENLRDAALMEQGATRGYKDGWNDCHRYHTGSSWDEDS